MARHSLQPVFVYHPLAKYDQDAAHRQCAKNAPEEDGMLVARWHLEVREDQHEDKDIIDAERLLEQVAGEEFERWLWPIPGVHA